MNMTYTILLLITGLALLVPSLTSWPSCEDSGIKWSPSWASEPRDDLRCQLSDTCSDKPTEVKSEEFDKCCACHSCAIWEGNETELFIEFVSVLGRSLVLADQALANPDGVYKIDHTDSEMIEIPSNLCNWDNDTYFTERYPQDFQDLQKFWDRIVRINFRNNKIRTLGNLNCLAHLDHLNLRNNRLTYITNTSLTNLSRLRFVDFSGNLIQKLDPGVLSSVRLNIFRADFSHNKMEKLDVSNMLSLYPFCDINFRSNEITEMVNDANFTLDMSGTYGPGFVHMAHNALTQWPDFKELLHLDDISQMGKLMSFGFDFREIPLFCDCHLEPFMSLAEDVIQVLWRDYMNVTCTGPEDLAGIPVKEVQSERFICKEPAGEGCPTPHCTCVDKPKENTLFVDCSYKQGTFMDYLPPTHKSKYSDYISLNFSGQHITNITNLTRHANISMLEVSQNDIKEIGNDIAKALENATFVDLSDNINLHQLPYLFLQYRNICSTNMKNLEIDCNCESAWLETWLHSKSCINNDYLFICIIPNGEKIHALSFKADDLECFSTFEYTKEFAISGVIALLVVTGMFIYTFRYETLILLVRLKQLGRNSSMTKFDYDIFLSFNNEEEGVLKWIYEFQKHLAHAGYRVFLPTRDIPFGSERDTEVISVINKSRNFLVSLTDNYLAQADQGIRPWTENEWKYGWYNFARDRYKNIVLINLDHVSSFDICHPQIKAFLRVGCTVDFKNHDRKIMQRICKKLGKPFHHQVTNEKAFANKKKVFQPNTLKADGYMEAVSFEMNDQSKCKEVKTANMDKTVPPLVWERDPPHRPQHRGPFYPYYEETSLQKTPHIPLFGKKLQNKTDQTMDQSFQNRLKIENLSKIYITSKAANVDPNGTANCPDANTVQINVNWNDEVMEFPAMRSMNSSTDDIPNVFADHFSTATNSDRIFHIDMSSTLCASRSSDGSTNTDTDSAIGRENSPTDSTSLGSSKFSFLQTSSDAASMTDVSV